jgi:hypothetical protein
VASGRELSFNLSYPLHSVLLVNAGGKTPHQAAGNALALGFFYFFLAVFFLVAFFTAFFFVMPHLVPQAIVPHPLSLMDA